MIKTTSILTVGALLASIATAYAEETTQEAESTFSEDTLLLAQSGRVCRVPCNSSGNSFADYDVYEFVISAGSSSAAKSYALSNHRSLCQQVGLLSVAQPIFCD